MPIYGVYNGSVVVTDHRFPVNQKVLLIPIDDAPKINRSKQEIIDKLFGCLGNEVPGGEMRDERLSRQLKAN